jgi:hypothetical protein
VSLTRLATSARTASSAPSRFSWRMILSEPPMAHVRAAAQNSPDLSTPGTMSAMLSDRQLQRLGTSGGCGHIVP